MANHKKTSKPRKARRPLPKVGSPADNAYRLEHSRRDVVNFGRTSGKGLGSWVLGALVVLVVLAGVIGLIAFT